MQPQYNITIAFPLLHMQLLLFIFKQSITDSFGGYGLSFFFFFLHIEKKYILKKHIWWLKKKTFNCFHLSSIGCTDYLYRYHRAPLNSKKEKLTTTNKMYSFAWYDTLVTT